MKHGVVQKQNYSSIIISIFKYPAIRVPFGGVLGSGGPIEQVIQLARCMRLQVHLESSDFLEGECIPVINLSVLYTVLMRTLSSRRCQVPTLKNTCLGDGTYYLMFNFFLR